MNKYGPCLKCNHYWKPKKYWNGKSLIWYNGCENCGGMLYLSGGVVANELTKHQR